MSRDSYPGLGNNFANTYENIGFFTHMPPQKTMSGATRRGQRPVLHSNVIHWNRATGAEREHNAAKPVGLLRELLNLSTDPGDTVVDLFLGSGSTLIAADGLGRRCFGMELDPLNLEITIRRWERVTGGKAVKL